VSHNLIDSPPSFGKYSERVTLNEMIDDDSDSCHGPDSRESYKHRTTI
jgi:hypothetical protein